MSVTQINGGTQVQNNTITSTQVNSSIIVAGGGNAFTGNQSFGSNRATNLADPTSAQDAATKNYVDTVAQGLSPKPSAKAATTGVLPACTYANGASGVGATLTGNANGALAAIDGYTAVVNDYILVKNQAAGLQNGLYKLTQVGDGTHPFILTRAVEMDDSTEFEGAFLYIENGTTNGTTQWVCTNTGTLTVGTTAITFAQLAGPNTITAGNGIVVAGNQVAVNAGNGLTFSSGVLVVQSDATGGANLARVVNVSANGVAVKVDGTTIAENGSLQLGVPTGGIGTTQLANAAVTVAKLAAQATGTGLKGGNGSNLALNISTRETPSGSINGSNTSFTLANTPVAGMEQLYLNGVLQDAGAGNDYTISGVTITMLSAPLSGDKLRCTYPY